MKGNDTKMRLLAVERMFQEGKAIKTSEIIRRLAKDYDIKADRKTIYDDINALTYFMNIQTQVTNGRKDSYKYKLEEM